MTLSAGFLCRPVQSDDLEAVEALWHQRDPRINELYRWRDHARTQSGGNGAWLVTHEGECVAAMNSVPFSIAVKGARDAGGLAIGLVRSPRNASPRSGDLPDGGGRA